MPRVEIFTSLARGRLRCFEICAKRQTSSGGETKCRLTIAPKKIATVKVVAPERGPRYDRNCPRPYIDPCAAYGPCVGVRPTKCVEKTTTNFIAGETRKNLNLEKILLLSGTIAAVYLVYKTIKIKEIIKSLFVTETNFDSLGSYSDTIDELPPEDTRDPKTSDDIPSHVQYLIIGGGPTSVGAFRSIRKLDPESKVLVITKEPLFPYKRSPMTKKMLEDRRLSKEFKYKEHGEIYNLFYEPDKFYVPVSNLETSSGGVAVAKGWRVDSLDVKKKLVKLSDGKVIKFDKCLIATGSKPRKLILDTKPSQEIRDKITNFKTLHDLKRVEKLLDGQDIKIIGIVGGGSIGTALATTLIDVNIRKKLKILLITKAKGPLSSILPDYLSKWTGEKLNRDLGIEVINDKALEDIKLEGNQLRLLYEGEGQEYNLVDVLIVAQGSEPDTKLGGNMLEIDPESGGYMADSQMMIYRDIYTAGDCSSFYEPNLQGRRLCKSENYGYPMGVIAGENMAGKESHYNSDLVDFGFGQPGDELINYVATGIADPKRMSTVGVYRACEGEEVEKGEECSETSLNNRYKSGFVFYISKTGKILGLLGWNQSADKNMMKHLVAQNQDKEQINSIATALLVSEINKNRKASTTTTTTKPAKKAQ